MITPSPPLDAASNPTGEASSRSSLLADAVESARAPNWEARKDALLAELEREQDRERAAELAYEVGELAERRLGDESLAVKSYDRSIRSDPAFRPTLWAIRRVFYRRGLWPNLVKLIDAETRYARDDDERADLLVEKARILEDKIKDAEAARGAYRRASELCAGCLPALFALERIALGAHDDDALLQLWPKLAAATTTP